MEVSFFPPFPSPLSLALSLSLSLSQSSPLSLVLSSFFYIYLSLLSSLCFSPHPTPTQHTPLPASIAKKRIPQVYSLPRPLRPTWRSACNNRNKTCRAQTSTNRWFACLGPIPKSIHAHMHRASAFLSATLAAVRLIAEVWATGCAHYSETASPTRGCGKQARDQCATGCIRGIHMGTSARRHASHHRPSLDHHGSHHQASSLNHHDESLSLNHHDSADHHDDSLSLNHHDDSVYRRVKYHPWQSPLHRPDGVT